MAADRGSDTDSPLGADLVVQAVDHKENVPVNGLIQKIVDSSSVPVVSSHIPDASGSSEDVVLYSPFHSPKPATEDTMSDTTIEDGELLEGLAEISKELTDISVKFEESAQDQVDGREQLGMWRTSSIRVLFLITAQSSRMAKTVQAVPKLLVAPLPVSMDIPLKTTLSPPTQPLLRKTLSFQMLGCLESTQLRIRSRLHGVSRRTCVQTSRCQLRMWQASKARR
jgi:hypothetical protein